MQKNSIKYLDKCYFWTLFFKNPLHSALKFGFRTYYEFQIFNRIQIHMVFKYCQILHLLSLLPQAVTYY